MANYRSIHVKFWNDGTIEGLSPNAKLLMLYFITNPYRNESGLYSITLKRMADDTGLTAKQRDRAVEELQAKERVFYDIKQSIVWVVNAIRHIAPNDNCKKSVRTDIEMCPSHALSQSLLFHYKSIGYSWVTEGFEMGSEPTYRVQGIGIGIGSKRKEEPKKKIEFVAPSVSDVVEYFKQSGFSEQKGKQAWNYYNEANWHDSKGNPVRNWKQKMIAVWFKEENREGSKAKPVYGDPVPRRSTYHCPKCETDHRVSDPCPPGKVVDVVKALEAQMKVTA